MITQKALSLPPPDHRFNVMLAWFAFTSQADQRERSVLCRVLDGRGLNKVCPFDERLLSAGERSRYSLIRDEKQRAMSVRARAELRRMLALDIGVDPREVPLVADAHGKPRCTHPHSAGIDFSVAHSDCVALVAVGEAAAIGVDLEAVIAEEPEEELQQIIFDGQEATAWRALPENKRRRAFTEAWTIKEAAVKASGLGLYGSPHMISVAFDTLGNAWPVLPDARWIFERINLCECYAASFIAIMPTANQEERNCLDSACPKSLPLKERISS